MFVIAFRLSSVECERKLGRSSHTSSRMADFDGADFDAPAFDRGNAFDDDQAGGGYIHIRSPPLKEPLHAELPGR